MLIYKAPRTISAKYDSGFIVVIIENPFLESLKNTYRKPIDAST